jgi:hypothetical protein
MTTSLSLVVVFHASGSLFKTTDLMLPVCCPMLRPGADLDGTGRVQ